MVLAVRGGVRLSLAILFSLLSLVTEPRCAAARTEVVGAVYTMDNSSIGNSVHIYHRFRNGRLAFAEAVPTGGVGTGEPLGNQGAIQIAPSESYLYAVNAGSNSISVFAITQSSLELRQTMHSQGQRPLSLSISQDRLYVLNAGGSAGTSDSIAGFQIDSNGLLSPIEGSVAALSTNFTRPAQIGAAPDGSSLVITERETHKISLFDLDAVGVPQNLRSYDSEGMTPFGFEFGVRGTLVVAEGALGDPNASSVSSYALNSGASLTVLTSSTPTFQTAACWLVLSPDKKTAFTTNPGSDSISRFSLNFDGELSLQRHWRRLLRKNDRPLDIAITKNSRTLYALLSGSNRLAVITNRGSHKRLRVSQRIPIPAGANGLAVW